MTVLYTTVLYNTKYLKIRKYKVDVLIFINYIITLLDKQKFIYLFKDKQISSINSENKDHTMMEGTPSNQKELKKLLSQTEKLIALYQALQLQHNQLQKEYASLETEYKALLEKKHVVQQRIQHLLARVQILEDSED